MFDIAIWEVIGLVIVCLHVAGLAAAVHALVYSRTPQGAIAWASWLVMFPYVVLPVYLTFGRGKFQGYVRARRAGESQIDHIARGLEKKMRLFRVRTDEVDPSYRALEQFPKMPFTSHNDANLLINGRAAFDAMFAGIASATQYILVQFYIIRDDVIGRELKKRLEEKALAGVRVYVLYDEIGCYYLPGVYRRELAEAGVQMLPFRTSRGLRNRFQINFRNHRKIVLVDGRVAYVGGMNVGDEYLGQHPKFGPWRDTAVEVTGPVVEAIQFSFLEDWHWATGQVPDLEWGPRPAEEENQNALVLASGPSDDLETCELFFVHAINAARRRLWIASPYFVPDGPLLCALQLAALRGVDVRIMLPERPDHKMVYLAAFSFIEEAEPSGVKFYRYEPGFMHHKVILVDDDFAAVGTANFDNRSTRLNFELMLLFADEPFASQVARMLEEDFSNCRLATAEAFAARGFWFHVAVRMARLMSPLL